MGFLEAQDNSWQTITWKPHPAYFVFGKVPVNIATSICLDCLWLLIHHNRRAAQLQQGTVWPIKSKIFTIWRFTEKVCQTALHKGITPSKQSWGNMNSNLTFLIPPKYMKYEDRNKHIFRMESLKKFTSPWILCQKATEGCAPQKPIS